MDNIKNGTLIINVDSLSDIEKIDRVMVQCGVWCGMYYPASFDGQKYAEGITKHE